MGLLVGDLHNGNTVQKGDAESAMTVEAFHAANDSLMILAYG